MTEKKDLIDHFLIEIILKYNLTITEALLVLNEVLDHYKLELKKLETAGELPKIFALMKENLEKEVGR